MILRTLIIDDEPLAHEVLLEYVREIPFMKITGQFYRATDAIEHLASAEVDLILLDVQMPALKGTDFLRTLRQKPLVIITSAFEQYALEGFELDVCDYLLKPVPFERFLKAVNKAFNLYRLRHPQKEEEEINSRENAPQAGQIFIKADKKHIRLNPDDIYYLESEGNYVRICLADEKYLTLRTLSSFAAQLPQNSFIRIHKSCIINRNYIDYVEGNMVVLSNAAKLLIGKSYRQKFRKMLGGEEA
jgi:DNA-binding LytR/AlgR family response regulator